MKDSSIPEDQILDIKPIAKAYDIFFADMVKVSQKDGKFILSGDNDQRIQTALICHVPLIPVILIWYKVLYYTENNIMHRYLYCLLKNTIRIPE